MGLVFSGILGALTESFVVALAGLFVIGPLVGAIISLAVENLFYGSKNSRAEQEYELEMEAYPRRLAAWERANHFWEQMYYCYRDDIAFLPSNGSITTPDELATFCYGQDNGPGTGEGRPA